MAVLDFAFESTLPFASIVNKLDLKFPGANTICISNCATSESPITFVTFYYAIISDCDLVLECRFEAAKSSIGLKYLR